MGLDMYLTEEVYVGGELKHRNVRGEVSLTIGDKKLNIDPKTIKTITLPRGYWRKANAIHGWFVVNVQNGKDDCDKYYVPWEKFLELKALCEKVLETKDASLLPPQEGFFFGSTDVNEGYYQDLKDTLEIISKLNPSGDHFYTSSW